MHWIRSADLFQFPKRVSDKNCYGSKTDLGKFLQWQRNQRASMYSIALKGYAFMVIKVKENKKNSSITLYVDISVYS